MTVVRFRTRDLPAEHRFAAWHHLITESHMPMAIDSHHRDDFQATIEVYDVGGAALSRLHYPPLLGHRTRRLIRQSDPEMLLVSYVLQGRHIYRHRRDECVVDTRHVIVKDSSRDETVINDTHVTHTVLQLPRSVFDHNGSLKRLLHTGPIPATHGLGAVLARVLTDLAEHGGTHPPAVTAALTATALDLLAAAARLATGSRAALPEDSRTRIRRFQIQDYIRHRLADPTLTPASVANACGVSVRQLQRVFQAEGTTPAAWIRRRRLERCRRDLVDPALASRPVVMIGARWGYPDPATFNRAFRREFGLPPGEYRNQFMRGTDTADSGE
ncbi:MAG: AraC family transcriptional regulator [Micromonosporaceae bacterium]|nr:AraC family transcriptional regulator [Micromonosporaceae bacterium]